MPHSAESIIFVVDGKSLEAMSLLLAVSLANTHDTEKDVQVIAYVSERSLPQLSKATRQIYESCNVAIAPLPANIGIWAKDYPHGNKLIACAANRTSNRTIFLDTDVVCLGKITGLVPDGSTTVCAVPEGLPTWGKDGDAWTRAYGHFNLAVPDQRVTLTRGRKIEYPPYFNAGFVSFSDALEDHGGEGFGSLWLKTARNFDWGCSISKKRPWLDQITLPLTMAVHNLSYTVLDDAYNFSVAERKRLGKVNKSKIIHYHGPEYYNAIPRAKALLASVRERTLCRHMDEVDLMLRYFTDAVPEPGTISV